ncbi:MAG: PSD1 and planctomycete cytochrome C domain-containing protein [Pirellulales bacterium]
MLLQSRLFRCAPILFAALCGSPYAAGADELQFNRDVRPILSAACFRCHGFDAKARQADLRLDSADDATRPREDGPAVVPGKPDESSVWKRIVSADKDLVMPPPDAIRQLTDAEKETLKRWIAEGAKYQRHWSVEPITNPAVPAESTEYAAWNRNPIDRFLLQKIVAAGLKPQPEADRATLVRRVAFTLTGLPPTLEEIDLFTADTSPDAYEAMVDRYLESSAYGEEMAKHWLDMARYGDTHGLHLDNVRDIWAYRDWVVSAFNSNKPFDQFTIEQLAGDQLPNPTKEQLIATGFNRCNVTTSEGGAIVDEFLFRYAVDRSSTTIGTWMGMTGGCAVCHDHKYDPLSMKEFYSFYAFFYSAADPAMDGNKNDTPPYLSLSTAEQDVELARLRKALNDIDQQLQKAAEHEAGSIALETDAAKSAAELGHIERLWMDDELPIGAGANNTTRNREEWVTSSNMEIPVGRRALKTAFGDYSQQKMDGGLIPKIIPTAPKLSFWIHIDRHNPSRALMIELATGKGTRRFGWGEVALLRKGEFNNADNRRVGDLPEAGRWHRITLSAEDLHLEPGTAVNDLLLAQFGGIAFWDGISISGDSLSDKDPAVSIQNWLDFAKGKNVPTMPKEVAAILKSGKLDGADEGSIFQLKTQWAKLISASVSSDLKARRSDWLRARIDEQIVSDAIPGTMIFKDLPEPRQAHMMKRGQYDQPGDKVEPGTPAFLPPLKKADEKRATRLDMAKWLISDEHPLTARVTVNRFWQQVFGIGLVKTSDDFGTQGEPPSHPELLDSIAAGFRESKWDVKRLMRNLLTSAAFRQGSKVEASSLEKDPQNRLLSRGPRLRLDAEQIRDNALAVSGMLNRRMGGPGFLTYQPPNIWEPVGYGDSNTRYYLQDFGPDIYRRSLYSFIKRTAPPPFLLNFDAPNREMVCTRRERSNTPLQALQLMNDIQHVEAARGLAARILKEADQDDEARIRFAVRTVLGRSVDAGEVSTLKSALDKFRGKFADNAADAQKLVAVGQSAPPETIEAKELASFTLLANLILNLDEAVTRK